MKSKVDKLDIAKLVHVPVDLSKLSDTVKNDVVKIDVYNTKIKNIEDKIPDNTNLATNASLNAKINGVKGEIPSITNLATTAALNTKINEIPEIPDISNLGVTTALAAVENKIPNAINLVQKIDYNTKIRESEKKINDYDCDRYITTPGFNKVTSENFTARLKQENLVSKIDIVKFVKKTDFDNKLRDVTSTKN